MPTITPQHIELINKLLIQSIFIKYLEERVDSVDGTLFSDKYFKHFGKAEKFSQILKEKIHLYSLFNELNQDFNGNIFVWELNEIENIEKLDLNYLADMLDAESEPDGQFNIWRNYDFRSLPVEVISTLYEEFLIDSKEGDKTYYTPSHLARMLIDEVMPLRDFEKHDPMKFKILDPSCGSGIFLVLAFKRLIQWWKLRQIKLGNNREISLKELKMILHNIYGVDKQSQAIKVSAFSLCLSLCDELNLKQILENLKFDDLTLGNLISSDFFDIELDQFPKVDIVIGNPPFSRGGIDKKQSKWIRPGEKGINIPQQQIALKFLIRTIDYVKKGGLICMILKSSSLLYNIGSFQFRSELFRSYSIPQIFDFTALARNQSLWDSVDVDTLALFLKNEKPDYSKNTLHLVFKRTIPTVRRIYFEFDDLDMHYVNPLEAQNDPKVWKVNLLGGHYLKHLIKRLSKFDSISKVLSEATETSPLHGEDGFSFSTNFEKNTFDTSMGFITSRKANQNRINYGLNISLTVDIETNVVVINNNQRKDDQSNLLLVPKGKQQLLTIQQFIIENKTILQFYLLCTSPKALVNKNSAVIKHDINNLPYFSENPFDRIENILITEVVDFSQYLIRNGENSKMLSRLDGSEQIKNYGHIFSVIINRYLEDLELHIELSEVISIGDMNVAAVFRFETVPNKTCVVFKNVDDIEALEAMLRFPLSEHLRVQRTAIYTPNEQTLVLVKPYIKKYWMAIAAYTDAEKLLHEVIIRDLDDNR